VARHRRPDSHRFVKRRACTAPHRSGSYRPDGRASANLLGRCRPPQTRIPRVRLDRDPQRSSGSSRGCCAAVPRSFVLNAPKRPCRITPVEGNVSEPVAHRDSPVSLLAARGRRSTMVAEETITAVPLKCGGSSMRDQQLAVRAPTSRPRSPGERRSARTMREAAPGPVSSRHVGGHLAIALCRPPHQRALYGITGRTTCDGWYASWKIVF
jgi:hypothetical protein